MSTGSSLSIHRLRRRWRHHLLLFTAAVLLLAVILTLTSSRFPAEPHLEPNLVDLTLLSNAIEKGALCLDGSRPGYHLQKGFGSGKDSWVVHIEGGGWCETLASCLWRKGTPLGSSRYMNNQVAFVGILSRAQLQNPDFFNWNRVKMRYCDGASLSGDVETKLQNGKKLLFRGQRIWDALMDELLPRGLASAKQALLTGCSAGGLATFIHCDDFRALMPKDANVKCLADAGFFLDEKDISGKRTMQSFYQEVVHLQDVGKNLPKNCTTMVKPAQLGFQYGSCDHLLHHQKQCFFPRELIKSIKTPFFIVNPAYDFWQHTSRYNMFWHRRHLILKDTG